MSTVWHFARVYSEVDFLINSLPLLGANKWAANRFLPSFPFFFCYPFLCSCLSSFLCLWDDFISISKCVPPSTGAARKLVLLLFKIPHFLRVPLVWRKRFFAPWNVTRRGSKKVKIYVQQTLLWMCCECVSLCGKSARTSFWLKVVRKSIVRKGQRSHCPQKSPWFL